MQPSTPTRPVIVLVGPSGAGKSTVARALQDTGAVRIHPTWTTRPPRPDELVGAVVAKGRTATEGDHRFVTVDEFAQHEAAGGFAAVGGLPGLDHRYGLEPIHPQARGPIDLVIARADHVARIAALVPSVVVLMIDAPDDALRTRLAARSLPSAEVEARLQAAAAERAAARRVAHATVTNVGEIPAVLAKVRRAIYRHAPAVPEPPEAHPVLRIVLIALLVAMAVAALAGVAFVVLFFVAMSNWSSNK